MSPTAVPWTNEERELWRRAEAGEEFAPPEPEEEEPMSEFAPKSADDLGGQNHTQQIEREHGRPVSGCGPRSHGSVIETEDARARFYDADV
jgi:hypothetical protein